MLRAAACEAVYQLHDEWELAARCSERALANAHNGTMPAHIRALVLEAGAVAALNLGDYGPAEDLARESASHKPRVQACLMIASAAYDRGRFDEATYWAERAYPMAVSSSLRQHAEDLLARARAGRISRDLRRALRVLTAIRRPVSGR